LQGISNYPWRVWGFGEPGRGDFWIQNAYVNGIPDSTFRLGTYPLPTIPKTVEAIFSTNQNLYRYSRNFSMDFYMRPFVRYRTYDYPCVVTHRLRYDTRNPW
jgi:hypothetical protein